MSTATAYDNPYFKHSQTNSIEEMIPVENHNPARRFRLPKLL